MPGSSGSEGMSVRSVISQADTGRFTDDDANAPASGQMLSLSSAKKQSKKDNQKRDFLHWGRIILVFSE